MATIPLPQFPPEFKPKCFKCSSLNVHFNFTKHSWAWNQSEIQYSCGACGVMCYGEDAIIGKFSLQLKDWRREQEAAKVRVKQETEKRALEAAEAAARRLEEERIRAEQEETSRRISHNAAEMKRRAEENAAMVAAALERRRLAALERKRAHDRERNARSRARKRELAATQTVSEPVVLPPDQEARRQAQIEKKRAYDRERTARIRATRQEAAALASAEREEAARVVAAQVIEDALEPEVPADDEPRCSWQECDKPRTTTSKYCSRRCSNKNARWNAKHKGKSA